MKQIRLDIISYFWSFGGSYIYVISEMCIASDVTCNSYIYYDHKYKMIN